MQRAHLCVPFSLTCVSPSPSPVSPSPSPVCPLLPHLCAPFSLTCVSPPPSPVSPSPSPVCPLLPHLCVPISLTCVSPSPSPVWPLLPHLCFQFSNSPSPVSPSPSPVCPLLPHLCPLLPVCPFLSHLRGVELGDDGTKQGVTRQAEVAHSHHDVEDGQSEWPHRQHQESHQQQQHRHADGLGTDALEGGCVQDEDEELDEVNDRSVVDGAQPEGREEVKATDSPNHIKSRHVLHLNNTRISILSYGSLFYDSSNDLKQNKIKIKGTRQCVCRGGGGGGILQFNIQVHLLYLLSGRFSWA